MKDYKKFFTVKEESRDFEVEELYQAFKARLIDELRVEGHGYDGAIHGRLENK